MSKIIKPVTRTLNMGVTSSVTLAPELSRIMEADHIPRTSSKSEYSRSVDHTTTDINKFDVKFNIDSDRSYLELIKKFKEDCKTKKIAPKPEWNGLLSPDVSNKNLEMFTHAEKIFIIFKTVMEKIKMVGYLPHFFKNDGELVRKYMPESDANHVLLQFSAKTNRLIMKKVRTQVGTIFNSENEQVLSMLAENKCISKYAEQKKLPTAPFIQQLLDTMKRLLHIIGDRLKCTAEEEFERRDRLKKAFTDYKKRTVTISRLEEKLNLEQADIQAKLATNKYEIEKYKDKIREVKKQFRGDVTDLMCMSERKMGRECELRIERTAVLLEFAKDVEAKYQVLLENNLSEEKLLRAKRFKTEMQLATWIGKYDADVTERQNQIDELMLQSDAERENYAELECLFVEQNKLYSRYKEEKDAEDEALFNAVLYKFVSSRAARIIQRAWRVHRARKLARRKRKGKGKGAAKGKK